MVPCCGVLLAFGFRLAIAGHEQPFERTAERVKNNPDVVVCNNKQKQPLSRWQQGKATTVKKSSNNINRTKAAARTCTT